MVLSGDINDKIIRTPNKTAKRTARKVLVLIDNSNLITKNTFKVRKQITKIQMFKWFVFATVTSSLLARPMYTICFIDLHFI